MTLWSQTNPEYWSSTVKKNAQDGSTKSDHIIDFESTSSTKNTAELEDEDQYLKTVHIHQVKRETVPSKVPTTPQVITIPDCDHVSSAEPLVSEDVNTPSKKEYH